MRDVAVLKTAHNMHDRIDLTDGGEKLVAEAFALGCAAHESGDIDKRDARGNDLRRLPKHRQFVQPRVRHRNLADIRLDRAEWIVGGLCRRGLRQGIEECRLAHIWQADNAAFESHDFIVSLPVFLFGGGQFIVRLVVEAFGFHGEMDLVLKR